VAADAFFVARREQLVARAAKIDVAIISDTREFASVGALLTYGASASDGFQKWGLYVARILKGEKPSDLPVLQPTKFDLVINLKAAKTLGLDIPPTVSARATEVIE
jgi:putative ABC transport system substrate-binding protein